VTLDLQQVNSSHQAFGPINRSLCHLRWGRGPLSVPSVTSLSSSAQGRLSGPTLDPHPNRLQTLPRRESKVGHAPSFKDRSSPDRTCGLGLPHGRCPHTRSPLRAYPKRLPSPLLMRGVVWLKRIWLHSSHVPHAA
jgi:hypothetical protein